MNMNMTRLFLISTLIVAGNIQSVPPYLYRPTQDRVFYHRDDARAYMNCYLATAYGSVTDINDRTHIRKEIEDQLSFFDKTFFVKLPNGRQEKRYRPATMDHVERSFLQEMCASVGDEFCRARDRGQWNPLSSKKITNAQAMSVFRRVYESIFPDKREQEKMWWQYAPSFKEALGKKLNIKSERKQELYDRVRPFIACNKVLNKIRSDINNSPNQWRKERVAEAQDMLSTIVEHEYQQTYVDRILQGKLENIDDTNNTTLPMRSRSEAFTKKQLALLRNSLHTHMFEPQAHHKQPPHAFRTSGGRAKTKLNIGAASFVPTQNAQVPKQPVSKEAVSVSELGSTHGSSQDDEYTGSNPENVRLQSITPFPERVQSSPWDFGWTSPGLEEARRRNATPFSTPVGLEERDMSTEQLKAILEEFSSSPSPENSQSSPSDHEDTSRASTARPASVDDWFACRFAE